MYICLLSHSSGQTSCWGICEVPATVTGPPATAIASIRGSVAQAACTGTPSGLSAPAVVELEKVQAGKLSRDERQHAWATTIN